MRAFIYRHRQFLSYSLIGCSGALLDFTVFILLVHSGIHYMIANACSISLAIIHTFFWNRHCTFKVYDQTFRRFIRFACVGLLGLATSSLLLYVLVTYGALSTILAKLLTIVVVVFLQYNFNKKFTFRL